jgi:TPR repeat protein
MNKELVMELSPDEISNILAGTDLDKIEKVVSHIKEKSLSGDVRSNYMISLWHRDGLFGFKKDNKKYLKFLKIAMNGMLPEAIYEYGNYIGTRYKKDKNKEFSYYMLSAILGDVDAISAVENYFVYGSIFERDDFIATSLHMRKNYLGES